MTHVKLTAFCAVWLLAAGLFVLALRDSAGTTGPGLELPPVAEVPPDVLDVVVSRLKTEEGFRSHQYNDSEGNPTIGYGTLLPLLPHEIEHLGDDRDLARVGITAAEAEWFLRGRLERNAKGFIDRWPPYESQPFAVQVVLIDATYQLGAEGLLRLDDMLGFLAAGDYAAAAEDVLQTLWAEQTPARADSAAAVFRRVAAGV